MFCYIFDIVCDSESTNFCCGETYGTIGVYENGTPRRSLLNGRYLDYLEKLELKMSRYGMGASYSTVIKYC